MRKDVIALGRSSIDLYSQNIGAPFKNIEGFNAFVGGSPLNIAVGCQRLGLTSALITGIGDDKVGEFIKHYLDKESVIADYVFTIKGARSSAVLLGIEKDKFPLIFYRDNAADSQIDIDHILKIPFEDYRVLEISGTALNKEPSRSASFLAAEKAKEKGLDVTLDVDFRADQWHDIRAFGITLRSFLQYVDIVIGTEEELLALYLENAAHLEIADQQISAPKISGDVEFCVQKILEHNVKILILKRGAKETSYYVPGEARQDVPGFCLEEQEVVNALGAGDAFAAGYLYGYLQGWDHYKSIRMGNACGAYLVTQPGCSNFSPTLEEIHRFIDRKGGFNTNLS